MPPHTARFNRPQMTTMPRPKTAAAAYLNAYKLMTEKHRLQQELESLDLRQHQLKQRLAFIDSQVAEMEKKGELSQQSSPSVPSIDGALSAVPEAAKSAAKPADPDLKSVEFKTMFLEY